MNNSIYRDKEGDNLGDNLGNNLGNNLGDNLGDNHGRKKLILPDREKANPKGW